MHWLILVFLSTIFSFATSSVNASNSFEYTPNQIRSSIRQYGGPEQFLKRMASDTAKMSGQMVDKDTEITGAIAQEKTIVYYLRLVNFEVGDIKNYANLRANVASMNSKAVCTGLVASILIYEHDAEYKYMIYSRSRAYLFTYSFNKTTCSPNHRW